MKGGSRNERREKRMRDIQKRDRGRVDKSREKKSVRKRKRGNVRREKEVEENNGEKEKNKREESEKEKVMKRERQTRFFSLGKATSLGEEKL